MIWPLVPLQQCARIVGGATPKTSVQDYWDGEICWATPKDLSDLDGPFLSTTSRKITDTGLDSCPAEILPVGSVLLSSRAPIGHVAINKVPTATNQGFKSLIPSDRLHAGYLFWWLKSNKEYLERLGNGATFKEISKAVVERIEIPLPPLDEQQRIAAILDQADALRRARRRALDRLDDLGQSIFYEMFGDPVSNPNLWPDSTKLGEIAEIVSGVTKGRSTKGHSTTQVPYLAVLNVQDKHLDLSTVKTIEATDSEIKRYRLVRDDLLLTEGGDPDKLGRGSLWEDELPLCIHQNHVFRVRLTTISVTPLFLNWLVGSQRGKQYFLRSAKQTTGIASINMTQLREFPMLMPPTSLQLEFGRRIERVNSLLGAGQSSLSGIEALFTSLKHLAFTGELTKEAAATEMRKLARRA